MRRSRLSRRPPTSRGERSPWVEVVWTVTLLIAVASVGKGEDNVDCYTAEDKGASYIGTVNVTVNGLVCQRWDQQAPWTHRWNPSNHPDKNLASNYCRNPDNGSGPWCYTTNPDVSFEYCNVSVCPNGQCMNLSPLCGQSPGWPDPALCTTHYVSSNCQEFCGGCSCDTDPRGPCQNGGTRGGNPANYGSFTCDCNCPAPWTGDLCEVCTATCFNGGVVDQTTCSCQCAPGYYGDDCSETCKNLDPKCGASPGWPLTSMCADYVLDLCPEFCGVCSCDDDPRGPCVNGGSRGGNPALYGDDTCNCNCVGNWVGERCEMPCIDSNPLCGANPGWPDASMCSTDYVMEGCHAMCGVCTLAEECTDADSGVTYQKGQQWAKHDAANQHTMLCTCLGRDNYVCEDVPDWTGP
uniref:Kringle domain-containing protein n=1 Tax=Branchiostoma floridae TaxID=7739 RepID=C3YZ99_BRAFL|eukprot:XP_002598158.1 hypothetical protein BRAFLDRAFT_82943 [Branchiostoma floridae]